jgi:glutathione S-transferase
MRARWALQVAGVVVNQTEVSLRAKPAELLAVSPKGTVPVLVLPGGRVIEQSLDIMRWALEQNDPEGWLCPDHGTLNDMLAMIDACERDFKPHVDRYKYPVRYRHEWAVEQGSAEQDFSNQHFDLAVTYLQALSNQLADQGEAAHLAGKSPALADFAIVPFVRQMARHDRLRFEQAVPASLVAWMDGLLSRADFHGLMRKTG